MCSLKTEPADPSGFLLPVEFYYTSDLDCNDPTVQQSIKDAFLTIIQNSGFQATDYCKGPTNCSATDIQIVCGPTATTRRRRDLNSDVISEIRDAESDPVYQKLSNYAHKKKIEWEKDGLIPIRHESDTHRLRTVEDQSAPQNRFRKRDTSRAFDMTVYLNVQTTFNPDPNGDVAQQAWSATDDFLDMLFEIYDKAVRGDIAPIVQGVNIYPRLKDGLPMNWSMMKLTSVCQNGYAGISAQSMLCCKYIVKAVKTDTLFFPYVLKLKHSQIFVTQTLTGELGLELSLYYIT